MHDISEIRHREQRLRTLAETDTLTGIANRNMFMSHLNDAIELAEAGGDTPSMLFLDLDGFKEVNDHFGHGKGDQVLREVALKLQTSVRAGDLVARHGGDEFAILMLGASRQTLEETAERIMERLRMVITGEGDLQIEVTCSIGIAIYPNCGNDAISLLKHADTAMYKAKLRGKNGYFFASALSGNT